MMNGERSDAARLHLLRWVVSGPAQRLIFKDEYSWRKRLCIAACRGLSALPLGRCQVDPIPRQGQLIPCPKAPAAPEAIVYRMQPPFARPSLPRSSPGRLRRVPYRRKPARGRRFWPGAHCRKAMRVVAKARQTHHGHRIVGSRMLAGSSAEQPDRDERCPCPTRSWRRHGRSSPHAVANCRYRCPAGA